MNYLRLFRNTVRNRYFELKCAEAFDRGLIKPPIYLSIGTEHLPAVLFEYLPNAKIFVQHRCHSYYLTFGGQPNHLIYQLTNGVQGSASLANSQIFGHSGMLGDQVPIGIGYAHATNEKTVIVMGDAAAEEDYVLASIGYAVSKKTPCLILCEDNNLSILTEKNIRRSWNIVDVARGFGMEAIEALNFNSSISLLEYFVHKLPVLFNVKIERYCWHAGTHIEIPPNDNVAQLKNLINTHYNIKEILDIEEEELVKMRDIWQPFLKS